MKKIFILAIFFGFITFSSLANNQETIEEKVEVINIEVPVRVVSKGKLVGGLKKSDFLIYENKKLQQIHGFNEFRRKIKISDITLDAQTQKSVFKPRLFVLVFSLTDYHIDMDKGIDFLFDKILRKNDRLMILANNTLIREKTIIDLEKEKKKVKEIIKRESKVEQQRIKSAIFKIERIMADYKQRLAVSGCLYTINLGLQCINLIEDFLKKYLENYIYYKKRYLIPDINKYYAFAKYLEKVELEKWVINFHQMERFPKLKMDSQFRRQIERLIGALLSDISVNREISMWGRVLRKLLWEIDKELSVADDFPTDEIAKLFLRVNSTFHTIFMRSLTASISEDFGYKRISTNIENNLREITKLTGGELISSNNLEKSLETISEKEDIYYILTYSPKDKRKIERKIKVKLRNKSYKVLYDSKILPGFFKAYMETKSKESPKIQIEDIKFIDKILSFEVYNYKMQKVENDLLGKIEVHIKIVGEKNEIVFDKKNTAGLKKKKSKLSIRFNQLKEGDYFILINVKDLWTEKIASDQKKVFIK